jgi:hypothetical protein
MMLDELDWRQAAERGVRTAMVVIEAPCLDRRARMEDRREGVLVEELVAKTTVEALDAAVLRWLSGLDEV